MVTYSQACRAPRPPASPLSTTAAATSTPMTATTYAISSVVLNAAFVSVEMRRSLRRVTAAVSLARPGVRPERSWVVLMMLLSECSDDYEAGRPRRDRRVPKTGEVRGSGRLLCDRWY